MTPPSVEIQARAGPGWYPDPLGGGLRLWDGTGWTDRLHDPAPPSDVTGPSRPAWRRRSALLGCAVVGLAGWTLRPGHSHPAAAAATTVTSARTTNGVDCSLAARRPSPRRVVEWFAAHGLPVDAAASPPVPKGACAVVGFLDNRAPGGGTVVSFPSESAATAAAAASAAKARPASPVFAVGLYEVQLSPGLTGQLEQYRATLTAYVTAVNPARS